MESGTICNCYSTGAVTSSTKYSYNGNPAYSGGIVGIAYNEYNLKINITNCYSSSALKVTYSSIYPDTYSCAGGIIGYLLYPFETTISNCIALNSSITAIHPYSTNNAIAARITNYQSSSSTPIVSNNYGSSSMVIKKGKSEANLTTITDFTNTNKNGSNLTGIPVDLLNKYVMANPTYKGITLLKWKVQAGVNNGLPVFIK